MGENATSPGCVVGHLQPERALNVGGGSTPGALNKRDPELSGSVRPSGVARRVPAWKASRKARAPWNLEAESRTTASDRVHLGRSEARLSICTFRYDNLKRWSSGDLLPGCSQARQLRARFKLVFPLGTRSAANSAHSSHTQLTMPPKKKKGDNARGPPAFGDKATLAAVTVTARQNREGQALRDIHKEAEGRAATAQRSRMAAKADRAEAEQQHAQRVAELTERVNELGANADIPEPARQALRVAVPHTANEVLDVALNQLGREARLPNKRPYSSQQLMTTLMKQKDTQIRLTSETVVMGHVVISKSALTHLLSSPGPNPALALRAPTDRDTTSLSPGQLLWSNPPFGDDDLRQKILESNTLTLATAGQHDVLLHRPTGEIRLITEPSDCRDMAAILKCLAGLQVRLIEAEEWIKEQLRNTVQPQTLAPHIQYVRFDYFVRNQGAWESISPSKLPFPPHMQGGRIYASVTEQGHAILATEGAHGSVAIKVGGTTYVQARLSLVHKPDTDFPLTQLEAVQKINELHLRKREKQKRALEMIADTLGKMKGLASAGDIMQEITPQLSVLEEVEKRVWPATLVEMSAAAQQGNEAVQATEQRCELMITEMQAALAGNSAEFWQKEEATRCLVWVTPNEPSRMAAAVKESLEESSGKGKAAIPDLMAWQAALGPLLQQQWGIRVLRVQILTTEGNRANLAGFAAVLAKPAASTAPLDMLRGKISKADMGWKAKISLAVQAGEVGSATAAKELDKLFSNPCQGVWVPLEVDGIMMTIDTPLSELVGQADEEVGQADVRKLALTWALSAAESNKILSELENRRRAQALDVITHGENMTLYISRATRTLLAQEANHAEWAEDLTPGADIAMQVRHIITTGLQRSLEGLAMTGFLMPGHQFCVAGAEYGGAAAADDMDVESLDVPRLLPNLLQPHPLSKLPSEEVSQDLLMAALSGLINGNRAQALPLSHYTLVVATAAGKEITKEQAQRIDIKGEDLLAVLPWQEALRKEIASSLQEHMAAYGILRLSPEAEDTDWLPQPGRSFRLLTPAVEWTLTLEGIDVAWHRYSTHPELVTALQEQGRSGKMQVGFSSEEWLRLGEPQLQLGTRIQTDGKTWRLTVRGSLHEALGTRGNLTHLPLAREYLKRMSESKQFQTLGTNDQGRVILAPAPRGDQGAHPVPFGSSLKLTVQDKIKIKEVPTKIDALLSSAKRTEHLAGIEERLWANQIEHALEWAKTLLKTCTGPIFVPKGAGAGMTFFQMSMEDHLDPPAFLSADRGLHELRASIREILADLKDDDDSHREIAERPVMNGLILVPTDVEGEPPEGGWSAWHIEAISHSGISAQVQGRSKRAKKQSSPNAAGGAITETSAWDADAHMVEAPGNHESVASSPRTTSPK